MEGGVLVVVLQQAPLDGVSGAGAAEELGERLHLRTPVVQEPVVEDAKVPHLSPSDFADLRLSGRSTTAAGQGVSGGGGWRESKLRARRKDWSGNLHKPQSTWAHYILSPGHKSTGLQGPAAPF